MKYSSIGVIHRCAMQKKNKSKERHFQMSFSICTVNLIPLFKVQIKLNVMCQRIWFVCTTISAVSHASAKKQRNIKSSGDVMLSVEQRVKASVRGMYNLILIFAHFR